MQLAIQGEVSSDTQIFDQLKDNLSRRTSCQIETPEGDLFLIAADQQLFVQQAISDTPQSYRMTKVSEVDPRMAIMATHGRPVSELLWRLAYQFSGGSLLKGCQRGDVIRLKRYPNLTRLPAGRNASKIAALLRTRPTSVVLASRILGIDEREVNQFYSAAYQAGYVEILSRLVSDQPQEASFPNRQGLLGKVIEHLMSKV
jgi:hypothetical protein